MDDKNNLLLEKKYPKSRSNKACIGPCYHPKTWIIHPVTLNYVTHPDHPFCPVNEWESMDQATGKKITYYIDECYLPTHEEDISKKDIEMNILLPKIDFNCSHFLKIYYDIHSIEDAMNWIELNKTLPILTQLRIMECTWQAYVQKDEDIDTRIVDFYINVIKKKWITLLYSKLKKFIVIDNGKIYIDRKEASESYKKDRVTVINFIVENFINHNTIYKFLTRYIEENRSNWENISSHNSNIKKSFIKYIISRINI